jgi:hypothetical protein
LAEWALNPATLAFPGPPCTKRFRSKEEVFLRISADLLSGLIGEIREGLAVRSDRAEGLLGAFGARAVRNFDLINQSAEARERLDVGLEFSRDSTELRGMIQGLLCQCELVPAAP